MASWWWMLNRHTNGRPVLVDNMSGIAGPRMDSESDCDEDALEDTLTYSQESGEDDHDYLEDTFTISHFQPESEPDSKVNSIRFYNNPNYQSNQMRRIMSENPIHSSETSKLSLFQVLSDRAESADWPCQARLRGLHGDIDDEPGNVLVGPVSMPEGVDGGTVGQSDSGSLEDAGSEDENVVTCAQHPLCRCRRLRSRLRIHGVSRQHWRALDLRRSRGGGPGWRPSRALDGRESGYRPPRHCRCPSHRRRWRRRCRGGGDEQGCRR